MDEQLDVKKEYARYRMEKAKEEYNAALVLLETKHYRAANNRAYYAIFHGMRSVLAFDGYDSKKHSGIIAEFRRNYIKTGVFDSSLSDIIGEASEIRNASDYDDMFIVSISETEEQVANAKIFLDAVEKYVNERIDSFIN